MSIHKIPDKYLNTTLHFFRESFAFDDVGDLSKTAQTLAYSSIKGNLQANGPGEAAKTEYDIHGRIYFQSHVAYINRMDDAVERHILPADIMYDQETQIKYLVLGTELWQSPRQNIDDSHHIKIILRAISSLPKDDPVVIATTTSKANIAEPGPEPLGINVSDTSSVTAGLA